MGEVQRRPARRSLERRNPLASVAEICCTAALGTHHAGADGMLGCTSLAEQRAVARRNGPAQHVAAAAPTRLDRRLNGHVKASAGIKARELGADGKARVGNRPQPAPRGVAWLKHLLDQLARNGVAVCVDATAVGVVDRRPVLDNHLDQHADALQDIDRFKSRDHTRGIELVDQKAKGRQARDGGDVARQDKAVDSGLGIVGDGIIAGDIGMRSAGGVVLWAQ